MIQVETDRPVFSNINGDEEFTPLKPKGVKDQIAIADLKPVVIPTKPLTQTQQNIVDAINTTQKTSWWGKQSKTNKALIIAGSISVIGIVSFMVVRNMNSKNK